MAAVETDNSEMTDTPFVTKIIPSSQYACFIHRGPWATLPLTFEYIYHTWLPQTDRTPAHSIELESCDSFSAFFDDKPAEREIYIPIGI
jgi:AraC family transcriptional regulator